MFPATNNRPGTHQRKKGVILSLPFRKTPKSKERKGREGEAGGLSSQHEVAATTYGLPFDRYGHVKA